MTINPESLGIGLAVGVVAGGLRVAGLVVFIARGGCGAWGAGAGGAGGGGGVLALLGGSGWRPSAPQRIVYFNRPLRQTHAPATGAAAGSARAQSPHWRGDRGVGAGLNEGAQDRFLAA